MLVSTPGCQTALQVEIYTSMGCCVSSFSGKRRCSRLHVAKEIGILPREHRPNHPKIQWYARLACKNFSHCSSLSQDAQQDSGFYPMEGFGTVIALCTFVFEAWDDRRTTISMTCPDRPSGCFGLFSCADHSFGTARLGWLGLSAVQCRERLALGDWFSPRGNQKCRLTRTRGHTRMLIRIPFNKKRTNGDGVRCVGCSDRAHSQVLIAGRCQL